MLGQKKSDNFGRKVIFNNSAHPIASCRHKLFSCMRISQASRVDGNKT